MIAGNDDRRRADLSTADQDHRERRTFHSELIRYEQSRGYRIGWTKRTFLDRFGTSPPIEWAGDPPASHIRPETFQWLRRRAAEYAKACEAKRR